jgi:hypothetical protein
MHEITTLTNGIAEVALPTTLKEVKKNGSAVTALSESCQVTLTTGRMQQELVGDTAKQFLMQLLQTAYDAEAQVGAAGMGQGYEATVIETDGFVIGPDQHRMHFVFIFAKLGKFEEIPHFALLNVFCVYKPEIVKAFSESIHSSFRFRKAQSK